MRIPPTVFASAACFALPVLAVAVLNWEQVKPYVIVDPATAQGHVLYIYAPT